MIKTKVMKNYKKIYMLFPIVLIAMLVLIPLRTPTSIQAADKVKLSKTIFSKGLYQALKDIKADTNKDGYLSEKEIEKIKNITVKSDFDTKGLEQLTSLERLIIQNYTKKTLTIVPAKPIYLEVTYTGEELAIKGEHLIAVDVTSDTLKSFDATACTYVQVIRLNCSKLENINITGLHYLYQLNAENGKLTNIDLSDNPMLQWVHLEHNKLKKIDVSACPNLEHLYMNNNKLTEIDVTYNRLLDTLDLADNKITEIDLLNNERLLSLYLSGNRLKSVDLSALKNVVYLGLQGCGLTKIDVSKCTKLGALTVEDNNLTEIDCSKNKNLFNLNVINNKGLKKLYIKNKKNVAKKVLVKTKVTSIKRTNSSTITIYFKKNPNANGGYIVSSTTPSESIAGNLNKNQTHGSLTYLTKGKKYNVVLFTLINIRDTTVYGTKYVSKKKY